MAGFSVHSLHLFHKTLIYDNLYQILYVLTIDS